ncbi:hypothetical protein AB3X91_30835 [Paraburkholderia sp. BR14263]|uniref:hypothetical protein n=1 Tax=unclassified Paraburkholderia TaxID=2615204 RepID=UPI0034CDC70D
MHNELTLPALQRRIDMRGYMERMSRFELDVLRAVTSGDRFGTSPEVFAIASVIMGTPGCDRGLNVANVAIDENDSGAVFMVLVSLKDGGARALCVHNPAVPA